MLPQQVLVGGAKSRDSWTQAIIAAFDKMGLASNKYSDTQVIIIIIIIIIKH